MLTYYCKQMHANYVQGMNELMGVFLSLKLSTQLDFHHCYNLFVMFIDQYLPTVYIDQVNN
jgi:hypothetical protein